MKRKEANRMNEVLRAIFERRSIRKYTGEPVKREDIESVLQAGSMRRPAGTRSCGTSALPSGR